jgi:hypothetical protein
LKNIRLTYDGDDLVLRVNLKESHGFTSTRSGRVLVAKSGNWPLTRNDQPIPGDYQLNCTISRAPTEQERQTWEEQ